MNTRIKLLAVGLLLALPWAVAIGVPASYDRSIANVLVSEGYTYTNVPGDPGGPTKYGITIYVVRKYLVPGATAQDVKRLTLDQAKEIYRLHYWNAVGGDTLPAGVDYSVFDFAVNAGVARAQRAVSHCKAEDKDLGNATTEVSLIDCVNDYRMRFQMGLPSRLDKFKRGWRNRIKSVKNISRQMAGVKKPVGASAMFDLYSVPRLGIGKAYLEEPDAIH